MKNIIAAAVVLFGMAFATQANAHVGYRSLDVMNPFVASVTSDFGWYQGTEPTLGNSHDIRWFNFTLAEDSFVDIFVAATGAGTFPNFNGAGVQSASAPTFNSVGSLNVGFSLYSGLVPASSYENAPVNNFDAVNFNGLFNALGDTTMGNNGGQVNTIKYITSKNDSNSAYLPEYLTNYFLKAGEYTLAVGGASAPIYDADGITLLNDGTYGIVAYLGVQSLAAAAAAVQPVPVPGAVWLFGSAMAGLIGFGRRKQLAA